METTPHILLPLKPTQLSIKKLLILVAVTVAGGLAFGAVYDKVARVSHAPWLGAAVFHSFVAAAILIFLARRGSIKSLFFFWPHPSANGVIPFSFYHYLPSLLVLSSVLLGAAGSIIMGGSIRVTPDWAAQVAFVLWIPVIEELVFRAGIGAAFQKYARGIWGIWFSALLFAWVHTIPTIGTVMSGHMGLPLGPFLLGLICEYLRVSGGSLVPSIMFHMVCNGSVVVFSLTDARWMNWLNLLYS